jgi:DNA-binding NarL/FixJ family response regulator
MDNAEIIRVVLVDDEFDVHEISAQALKRTNDLKLVGAGGNGMEALELCRKLNPDVLVLDVMMPAMNGVEAARLIRSEMPQIKILALSSFQDQDTVQAMMQSGADGYIEKGPSLFHQLAECIRSIHGGKKILSEEALAGILATPKPRSRADFDLSGREMEVLKLMATGLNNSDIALQLGIKSSTVKYHINRICAKLGVHGRAEALIVAAKNNLV